VRRRHPCLPLSPDQQATQTGETGKWKQYKPGRRRSEIPATRFRRRFPCSRADRISRALTGGKKTHPRGAERSGARGQ
jgi:hypothetical protein